ncbi:MAG: hypothetical protein ACE5JB_06410 [bacterium]
MNDLIRRAIWIALLIIALPILLAATFFSQPKDVSFQLFFTSDLYGYLKPCG